MSTRYTGAPASGWCWTACTFRSTTQRGPRWARRCGLALATWPTEQRPRRYLASPRTEFQVVKGRDAEGDGATRVRAALWRNHSDFINPFEFIDFARLAQSDRDFDIMLEAKGKDLAALRLREDLAAFAPDLAARLG